jgi:hypothetical protein
MRLALSRSSAFIGYTAVTVQSSQSDPVVSTEQMSHRQELLTVAFVNELRSRSQSDKQIFESLHQELRRIARAKMRRERPDHTLQPTALVNEAYVKLFKTRLPLDFWDDPSRAVRFIANAMEQILNDHADSHRALKRGGDAKRQVPIDERQARDFGVPALPADTALLFKPEQSEVVFGVASNSPPDIASTGRSDSITFLWWFNIRGNRSHSECLTGNGEARCP